MPDWLTAIIANLLNLSGRLGLTLALLGGGLYALRARGIEPFASIRSDYYETALIIGLWGAIVAGVSVLAWLLGLLSRGASASGASLRRWRGARQRRKAGLKNLGDGYNECKMTLCFLYKNNTKRFPERRDNDLLFGMVRDGLLDYDDAPGFVYGLSVETYYVVPDYIWLELAKEDAGIRALAVPERPPWLAYQRRGWFDR